MPDGRRQIVDFLLPRDFFGFTTHARQALTVEALPEGAVLTSYPRRRVEAMADADPRLSRYIREVAFQVLARALFLGRTTAMEQVKSLLVEVAERLPGGTAEAFVLPMSRHDIADYLGLSVETVTTALTELNRGGVTLLAARNGSAREEQPRSSQASLRRPPAGRQAIPAPDGG